MGRLIDAGLVLDNLSGRLESMKDYDAVKDVINNMPTAYDPDKVVAQLEDKVKEYDKRIERRNGDCYFDETEKIKALEERARGIERAIEIVKGGGADE